MNILARLFGRKKQESHSPAQDEDWARLCLTAKFSIDQRVRHVKSGNEYRICLTMVFIEKTGEVAYMYERDDLPRPRKQWVRCRTEMEDGRFEEID